MTQKAAYVTLLTKASYLPGVLVLEQTLRAVGSRYPLVVMVTSQLSNEAKAVLLRRGIATKEVESLRPPQGAHSVNPEDSRFADTWTKLRCFGFVDYHRLVLLDADMIIMRGMDELMDLQLPGNWIAAAHVCACNPCRFSHYPSDWVPANCAYTPLVHPDGLASPPRLTEYDPRPYHQLNSGLVVLRPSAQLFEGIQRHLYTSPLVSTWSFPDQDLLSDFFRGRWQPLPWCYNALKTLKFLHTPLWRDDEVRCMHYIFHEKPWHRRVGQGGPDIYDKVNQWWWDRFDKLEREMRRTDEKGLELVLANVARI